MIATPPAGERLTGRARAYMSIVAMKHVGCAVSLIAWPNLFQGDAFDGLKSALPGLSGGGSLVAWGLFFMVCGLYAAWSAVCARENPARAALLFSIMCGSIWVGAFIAAAQAGSLFSPIGGIFAAALTAKDVTMIRDPLRNPFERVLTPRWTAQRS